MALTRKRVFIIAVFALIFLFLLSLEIGAVPNANWDLIFHLRFPRVLLAAAVGVGLAVAGVVLQALFSNPLCEPYTLGISSGAALGSIAGGLLGLQWVVSGLAVSAFLGALLFLAILYLISRQRRESSNSLLLAGVMLGFLGSSLVALWTALADSNGIQGSIFWLLGDLSRARLSGAFFAMCSVLGICGMIWSRAGVLDAFLMGEEGALSLGVDVSQSRRKMILLASILVGVCVSASGMIGFIGLIVPHLARKSVGALHRQLIPLSGIYGAIALIVADSMVRGLFKPYEVPVGVVTALVGAPAFLWMMSAGRNVSSSEGSAS
ncbi:MAG: iron ABC transporter permease [Bdellovibrionota bacterium]